MLKTVLWFPLSLRRGRKKYVYANWNSPSGWIQVCMTESQQTHCWPLSRVLYPHSQLLSKNLDTMYFKNISLQNQLKNLPSMSLSCWVVSPPSDHSSSNLKVSHDFFYSLVAPSPSQSSWLRRLVRSISKNVSVSPIALFQTGIISSLTNSQSHNGLLDATSFLYSRQSTSSISKSGNVTTWLKHFWGISIPKQYVQNALTGLSQSGPKLYF